MFQVQNLYQTSACSSPSDYCLEALCSLHLTDNECICVILHTAVYAIVSQTCKLKKCVYIERMEQWVWVLVSDICLFEAGSFSLGQLSGLLALVASDIRIEQYILSLIQSVILVSTQFHILLLHFRNSQSCNLKNGIPGLDSWDHVSWILHSANTILRNLASKMNWIIWYAAW